MNKLMQTRAGLSHAPVAKIFILLLVLVCLFSSSLSMAMENRILLLEHEVPSGFSKTLDWNQPGFPAYGRITNPNPSGMEMPNSIITVELTKILKKNTLLLK